MSEEKKDQSQDRDDIKALFVDCARVALGQAPSSESSRLLACNLIVHLITEAVLVLPEESIARLKERRDRYTEARIKKAISWPLDSPL